MVHPSGDVTFLFTDIEGSTRAWEEHGDAMPTALARHQAVVRSAVERNEGVVVKDTGDGLLAVFAHPSQGIVAAVEAQCGLRDVDWGQTGPLCARMGLHTGAAKPIEGDYHGPAVNRCARIMGVAHGGQVLLSPSTRELAAPAPADVSFLDLGTHRLRDLSAAVNLYQVLHPKLPTRFPPPASLDALQTNLPAELSSFVGRQTELPRLAEVLGRTRLLTITGVGGVGKTRIALQLAANEAEAFADGVWLVSLGGLTDPALVTPEVASALRIGEQPGRTWIESIIWFLRQREALLVLDNCEHVIDEVVTLVEAVLRACPRVRALATSREVMGIQGETTWQVAPLAMVSDGQRSEAEQLLVERVLEVDPEFRLSEEDSAAITQICRRLDGIPLAIELAAARARVLSLPEVADRLDQRFRLLRSESRTASSRQRTLEAAVAWSHELLEAPERRLFNRLSVFADSFNLDAVQQVCCDESSAGDDVLELVARLADRSLLVREQARAPARYRLLETLRAYGRERLAEQGELGALNDRHLAWVNSFVRSAAPLLEGPEQEGGLDRVATEINDIRAALGWALAGDGAPVGLGCAATLYRYWYIRGVREGRQWLDRLLAAAPNAPVRILAKALYADGSLAQLMGENDRAAAALDHSLHLYGDTGNERGVAWALHGLGMAEWASQEPQAVKARFEEALRIFRRLGDPLGIAMTLQFLGVWEATFGDTARAVQLIDEQRAIVRPTHIPLLVAHSAEASAVARWMASHDLGQARQLLGEALQLYGQVGSILCAAHCLENTAAWAVESGATEAAAGLLGATEKLREEAGTPVPPYEHLFYDATRERLLATLGVDEYEAQAERGRSLDLPHAIEAALDVVEGAM